jgi:hypothetical protein
MDGISFWNQVATPQLAQGDFLPDCAVPIFFVSGAEAEEIPTLEYDLVIVTQSCDLVNQKATLVACCPIFPIEVFEQFNTDFQSKGRWEEVRKGRMEGLHLVGSRTEPGNNRLASVVDFREIYSLPFDYLTKRAAELGPRWRLAPPFLEHFSQSFARFFMRVGLPASIPPYR